MATLVAAYTTTTTSRHHHHHRPPHCDRSTAALSPSSQAVSAISFTSMSKDDSNSMKCDSHSDQQSSNRPRILPRTKSALKSSIKQQQQQQQQDQREDSSSCDGNSIATPTGSLPQPRAVRFSPGVSSTTTGTTSIDDTTLPDLPTLTGTRQPLGRKARQAQVRKLLKVASSRDMDTGSVPPSIPSQHSKLS